MIDIHAGGDVPGHEMQILHALGFAFCCTRFACDTGPVLKHRSASEVVQSLLIRPELEAQVPVTELVEHASALGRLRSNPIENFHSTGLRVEPEQVAGVSVNAIDHV